MNFIKTLKNLPLLSLLAFSLAASPGLSLAGDNNQGRDKKQHSGDSASYEHKKSDKRAHYQQRQNNEHSNKPPQRVHAYAQNRHYDPVPAKKHHGKKHNAYQHNYHGHGHRHNQSHSIRYQTNFIVDEHRYRNNLNLRDLRFIFGLHTNNVDIILRD